MKSKSYLKALLEVEKMGKVHRLKSKYREPSVAYEYIICSIAIAVMIMICLWALNTTDGWKFTNG